MTQINQPADLAPFATAANITLPASLDNFAFADAPLFHSLYIATMLRDMTDEHLLHAAQYAATFAHRPDCAATIANYIDQLTA